jgi:hypothetical protein
MTNASITYMVGAFAGVFALAAYAAWVLIPAWSAYSRGWQRAAAVFLSLYVLMAFVGVGMAVGIGVVYFSDRL